MLLKNLFATERRQMGDDKKYFYRVGIGANHKSNTVIVELERAKVTHVQGSNNSSLLLCNCCLLIHVNNLIINNRYNFLIL